tara:strand:- start:3670 stop:4380 length:711 start_codon:yes stop_codon:yes gene_type:complete
MIAKLIEFVWPRLEGKPSVYNDFLNADTNISDENIETSIELGILMYEKQRDRIATIESKSSIYLGFFGTVVAILAFALKDIIFYEQRSFTHDLVLVFVGILIIYILQVMRYSINALERQAYHSFDESDFLHGDRQKLVVNIVNKVKKNYDVINKKVEYMTMAHEFTKRILWLLLIGTIALVALPVAKYLSMIPTIDLSMSSLQFDLSLSDYILGLVTIGLIVNYCQIRKIKKSIGS